MFRKEHFADTVTMTRLLFSILYWLLDVVAKTMKKMTAIRDFQAQGPTVLTVGPWDTFLKDKLGIFQFKLLIKSM
jgi:hypothetical protein